MKPTPIIVAPQTITWQAYTTTYQCNCTDPDPVAAQAACPIHAYNTGHLSYTTCNINLGQPGGCNCPPVTPAQVMAFVAGGSKTPIVAPLVALQALP